MEKDSNTKIEKKLVNQPQIQFTSNAMLQLALLVENDFTLIGKYFRILISGKGCDGFVYSTGFTDKEEDDFLIDITQSEQGIQVIIDPFAAFYLQDASVDFLQEHNNEGFVVTNHLQEKYEGKFWKADSSKVPPVQVK